MNDLVEAAVLEIAEAHRDIPGTMVVAVTLDGGLRIATRGQDPHASSPYRLGLYGQTLAETGHTDPISLARDLAATVQVQPVAVVWGSGNEDDPTGPCVAAFRRSESGDVEPWDWTRDDPRLIYGPGHFRSGSTVYRDA